MKNDTSFNNITTSGNDKDTPRDWKNILFSIIEILSGIVAGALIGEWVSILHEESLKDALTNFNKSNYLIFGIILGVVTVIVNIWEARIAAKEKTDILNKNLQEKTDILNGIKSAKKDIINNNLDAICSMYFNNVSGNDYQICAMILVNVDNTVRTPYYINEGCNPAIRRHRPADFSDIGELFAKKTDKVCKRITHEDWLQEDENYKNEVPESLRCIIAVPVYSTKEADSSEILGILEFDIFAQRENLEIDKDLFNSLQSWEKIESLRQFTKSIAHMLEL